MDGRVTSTIACECKLRKHFVIVPRVPAPHKSNNIDHLFTFPPRFESQLRCYYYVAAEQYIEGSRGRDHPFLSLSLSVLAFLFSPFCPFSLKYIYIFSRRIIGIRSRFCSRDFCSNVEQVSERNIPNKPRARNEISRLMDSGHA